MFIVERGAQIMAFVNAVLDAVIAIAGGGAGGVPGLIETALVTAIPVLIGFLAALLGIGGLADKVKKLFQSLSKPVIKAVDWIVSKIAAFGKKLWAKIKAGAGKLKDKFRRKKDEPAAGAAGGDRERSAIADADRMLVTKPTHEDVSSRLPAISRRYGVPLHLVTESKGADGEHVHVQTMATNSYKLSDQNPIPKPIREQYEEVKLGNGTPRIDPATGRQAIFQGRELTPRQRSKWQGSREWDVPGTSHRILQRMDGMLGYVLNHDYSSPFLFPAPWYPEGGDVPKRLGR